MAYGLYGGLRWRLGTQADCFVHDYVLILHLLFWKKCTYLAGYPVRFVFSRFMAIASEGVAVAAISSEWWGTGVWGQSPWSGGQGA